MKIKVKRHPKFDILYNRPKEIDLVIAIGGRGGKKTYEVSKFGAFEATIKKRRVAVLRDEAQTIRESILNEIFERFDTANKNGHFDGVYEKLVNGIKHIESNEMLVFTKGFRASSNEKRSHMKGISEVDDAIVEEAEDIRDFNKFATFKDSVRTSDRLIIVILNTPDIQHWIVRRYFNLEEVTVRDIPIPQRQKLLAYYGEADLRKLLDGYWKLIPKQIDGFACIQTSYLDNEYLPAGVVRDYEAYGDPNASTYDIHYYLTAILGFASSGRKGQVLKKAKAISLAEYLKIDATEIIGQDFGTVTGGIAGVKILGNKLFAREISYGGMDALQIGCKYCELGLDGGSLIIADSEDALTIGRLRRGWEQEEIPAHLEGDMYRQLRNGFYVRGVVKGKGSVRMGLSVLSGMELYFVDDYPINPLLGTTNLWHEVFNYIYAVNKEGEYTNEPIDDFNHLIDPVRYVAQSKGRFF